MKTLLFSCIVLLSYSAFSQTKLSDTEIDTLVKIAELYSSNTSYLQKDFVSKIEPLSTENLDGVVATFIRNSERKEVLSDENLNRPSDEELLYWYAIRNIHYNNVSKGSIKQSNKEVAEITLNGTVDSKLMIDNYYYLMHASIAGLFNDKNLKKTNLDLDSYELKSEFEKAALYFMVVNACTQRFKVLSMMKNNQKILDYASKLPKINDKAYYYYTDFNYEDFDWIGHEKVESYNERHMGNLYSTLILHFTALASLGKVDQAKELYANSLLSKPEYFQYSGMEKDLKALYKRSR